MQKCKTLVFSQPNYIFQNEAVLSVPVVRSPHPTSVNTILAAEILSRHPLTLSLKLEWIQTKPKQSLLIPSLGLCTWVSAHGDACAPPTGQSPSVHHQPESG